MDLAPDPTPGTGLAGWSPTKLLLVGMLLGYVIARAIEPERTRVVRFWAVPPPDLGAQH